MPIYYRVGRCVVWQRVVVILEPPALVEGLALRCLVDWLWMFAVIGGRQVERFG